MTDRRTIPEAIYACVDTGWWSTVQFGSTRTLFFFFFKSFLVYRCAPLQLHTQKNEKKKKSEREVHQDTSSIAPSLVAGTTSSSTIVIADDPPAT